MVKTPEEMVIELRERMRGGEGTIVIKNLFKPDELKGKARLIAEIIIPVGGAIGFHRHDAEEEIFYFISGKGLVEEAGSADEVGAAQEVGPGYAMLTGNGSGHSVRNNGADPLIMLAVILLYP